MSSHSVKLKIFATAAANQKSITIYCYAFYLT